MSTNTNSGITSGTGQTAPRSSRSSRSSGTPYRGVAMTAGVMYLVTIVFSIPAQFINYAPILNDPDYVLGAGADTRIMWGALFEVIAALACIGTAVVLYPVVRRQHEGAALGFVTARVFEASLIATGVVAMLSVVNLRQPSAAGTEAVARVVTSEGLVAVHDWTFLLGPGVMPGINAILLGYVMYRSGLVPRVIPAIGLIGAPFFLLVNTASIVGINEVTSAWTALVTLPIFAWEAALGVYLTVKGFRRDAVHRLYAGEPASRETPL